MTQVPIISGIYTDSVGEFRTAYPHNMVPVPKANGISSGYLRHADGIEWFATTPGPERGGIEWNGSLYRVRGSSLCEINEAGNVSLLGGVDGDAPVSMTYSFDDLAVTGGGNFYLWNGSQFRQVTDEDLGAVFSVVWVSGYFCLTDGEYIVVTELGDPETISPLKYGSSELDPDPIVALHSIRNELYAVNRYTIEVFGVTSSTGFPFQRIDGAAVERGAIGRKASTVFNDVIAFVGSAKNEAPGVFVASNGQSSKISTREVDTILAGYSVEDLEGVWVETRSDRSHINLYIHLPGETLVYDYGASQEMQVPVWHTLSEGIQPGRGYPARSFVYAYGKWTSGDPGGTFVGAHTQDVSTLYGDKVSWRFSTIALYNESKGAIVHEMDLVSLTGNVKLGLDPKISTRFSPDGAVWSVPRATSAGKQGDRARDIKWLRQGKIVEWRVQEFSGTSDAPISPVRLEMRLEPLAW